MMELELRGVIERLKIIDIIFFLDVFEMRWHERFWAIYKGVEVQEVYL